MDITKLNHGGLIRKLRIRDYRLENAPAGAIQLSAVFSLRDKIGRIKNQGTSSSCVAQATAYYVQLLNLIETNQQVEMSARDIYSLTAQPGGIGSYVSDAMSKICNSGCVPEAEAPSNAPDGTASEQFMTGRADITPQAQEDGMKYLAKRYVTWDNTNIDLYKQAIVQGNGMVAITWGNNACFQSENILLPDVASQMAWRHGIYFTGYDDVNKKLEFVNSWNGWGDAGFGYMPYDYVTKGYLANPNTLIDLPNDTWISIMSMWTNLKQKVLEFIKLKSVAK